MPKFSHDIDKLSCTLCTLASDWLYLFDLRPPPHGVVPKEPTRLPPLADRGESIHCIQLVAQVQSFGNLKIWKPLGTPTHFWDQVVGLVDVGCRESIFVNFCGQVTGSQMRLAGNTGEVWNRFGQIHGNILHREILLKMIRFTKNNRKNFHIDYFHYFYNSKCFIISVIQYFMDYFMDHFYILNALLVWQSILYTDT